MGHFIHSHVVHTVASIAFTAATVVGTHNNISPSQHHVRITIQQPVGKIPTHKPNK